MKENILVGTIDGVACAIVEGMIHRDTREVHGFEPDYRSTKCSHCGHPHECNDKKWSGIRAEPAYTEDGESYEVLVCDNCSVGFLMPQKPFLGFMAGLTTQSISVRVSGQFCLPNSPESVMECATCPRLSGKYLVVACSGSTAELIRHL